MSRAHVFGSWTQEPTLNACVQMGYEHLFPQQNPRTSPASCISPVLVHYWHVFSHTLQYSGLFQELTGKLPPGDPTTTRRTHTPGPETPQLYSPMFLCILIHVNSRLQELTGKVPPETPLQPGEPIPQLPKRDSSFPLSPRSRDTSPVFLLCSCVLSHMYNHGFSFISGVDREVIP